MSAGALAWSVAAGALCATAILLRSRARSRELAARAVHELRGPLAAARLALHGLARDVPPVAPRARAVDGELARAARALDDLLAAPTGDRVPERHEPVDVGRLVADAAELWRPVARLQGVEVRAARPPTGALVHGDRVRLAQACDNLLANAIEHGGGVIELRARRTARGVRIEVLDDGPGLPEPVWRLARGARGGRGARGRGLAIAADIAAGHGGRLAAAPSPRGARLAIDLPAATPVA
jgi:signal transduction histidine kinase